MNMCVDNYPGGLNDYYAWVLCIVCDYCYVDCDGASSGCP